MSTLALMDPAEVRARISRRGRATEGKKRRDAGFSLIEIMAGMAIIAILALAILPQFAKYFERAAVQNLSSEVSNAALTVESDYSLTGKAQYVSANVIASVASTNHSTETTLTPTVDSTGFGYVIKGTNTAVTHYCVRYDSQASGSGTTAISAGLKVTPMPTTGGCP